MKNEFKFLKKFGQKILILELYTVIYLLIIFFLQKKYYGFIDFYFSANDFWLMNFQFALMLYVLIKKEKNIF